MFDLKIGSGCDPNSYHLSFYNSGLDPTMVYSSEKAAPTQISFSKLALVPTVFVTQSLAWRSSARLEQWHDCGSLGFEICCLILLFIQYFLMHRIYFQLVQRLFHIGAL